MTAETRRMELQELTKAELVAIGIGLDKPVELDGDLKKGDMIDALLKAEGYAPADAVPTENSALADLRAKDLPPSGRLFDLPHERINPKTGEAEMVRGKQWSGRMFKLTILDTEEEHGPADVTVNGHNYRINRGQEVLVPEPVIEALNNAKVTTFRRNPDTNESIPYSYARYPFQATPVS